MKKALNPPTLRPAFGNYSHGILLPNSGSMLVTSGQLGVDVNNVIPKDFEAQAVLCFEAIRKILEEGGMDFSHVVRLHGFVTRREDFPTYMAVRDRYVVAPMPASTLIIVTGFTRPEFLVEVEATAVKPE